MTTVAVVAHSRKSLGGGLPALRAALECHGVTEPLWYEVRKSKQVPARVRAALTDGADLVFLWGGDGTVQRGIDALTGTDAAIAIVPAGTANLLAMNLGIPTDLDAAVEAGLQGTRRKLDVGVINDEHFAVMAGAGFDALMIRDADRGLKDRVGRLAYVYTGARHLRTKPVDVRIKVDGKKWFKGKAACVLAGNVGRVLGGIAAFDDAQPDDGQLELGVVTAKSRWQWSRALARTALGHAEKSPFVEVTRGRVFDVKWARKVPYELDGGDRPAQKRLRIEVQPAAVTICVPADGSQ